MTERNLCRVEAVQTDGVTRYVDYDPRFVTELQAERVLANCDPALRRPSSNEAVQVKPYIVNPEMLH